MAETRPESLTTRVAEICLLAGGIRRPAVETALRDRVWALRLLPERTVLDLWLDRLYDLTDGTRPNVRVLLSETPTSRDETFLRCRGVEIVTDPNDFRGPGGALRDATSHLDPCSTLLVAELGRAVLCDLGVLIEQHVERENLVTVAANHDGSPSGVYAITARALEWISPRGYVDLKEQWLPALREGREKIGVARLPGFGAMPLRTEREFRDATRAISDPSVVVTRELGTHLFGPLAGTPEESTSPNPGEHDRIVVRSSIFPDGSIKAAKNVVDGSPTGSHPLSDEHARPDARRRRGA